MIERSRPWIALTLLLAACGTARDTSDTAALAPSLGLTEMVLLWRTDGFDRGDTVYVNLAEISDAGTVSYYENGDPAGTLQLETLLGEDSTFFGDLFAHVVQWQGDLYLEDGLHRALRAALQKRSVLHARVLDLDARGQQERERA